MRCVASWSGFMSAERRADLVDQRQPDGVLRRGELDQPLPASVAGGERLGEQVLEQEHLDAALAHPGDELVVLVLRALDPQHVVEQQVVVVGRGQPLQAELRPVDHHLAQPSDLRVNPERRHVSSVPSRRAVTRRLGCPPCPSTICCDLVQRADRGAPAGRLDEAGRRVDLGSHRPGRELELAQLRRRHPCPSGCCSGVPQSGVHGVDVGCHHEQVGVDLTGEQLAGEVLVDDGLDADQGRAPPPGRNIVGTPPPPAQMTTTPWSSSQRIGPDLEDVLAARATARPGASSRRPA